MAKLWQKQYEVEKQIETFTVGKDYILDKKLVAADCTAGIAHAEMLASIGVLSSKEEKALKQGLLEIIELQGRGGFSINPEDEDCHTAIENYLTEKLGESGKKIHTGRSRNDQVLAALRIYTRAFLLELQKAVLDLARGFLTFAEKHRAVPMPGRTHMQIAMPSSVGLWSAAFAEALLEDYLLLETAYRLNDQCPLGAAASYGVPLPLDREKVAALLGFHKVQQNVLLVNNDRGKIESIVLDAIEQVGITLGKVAEDIIIFSMPEFGYFSLPEELCTGSSIMPQKKNPDLLELVRAKAATLSGLTVQVKNVIRSLPSGYNRDFQETKEPLLTGLQTGLDMLGIVNIAVSSLTVHEEALKNGFTPDIYATDAVMEQVRSGVSFREAYRAVAADLEALKARDPQTSITERSAIGTSGNLGLENSTARLNEFNSKLENEKTRIEAALRKLVGRRISVLGW
jgi:argininosuccinate lyase